MVPTLSLEKVVISADLSRNVKRTYERTVNCIETNKGQSAWFETRLGVRQGSILSLILLNVMMNDICNKVREKLKVTD
jgi:hypothetical protein